MGTYLWCYFLTNSFRVATFLYFFLLEQSWLRQPQCKRTAESALTLPQKHTHLSDLVECRPFRYFDELLEYSYSFSSADGTACAFLFQNINQGNFTFSQLGVPSDAGTSSNMPFTCGNDFFITARRAMGMDSGLELLGLANSSAYFEMYDYGVPLG